MSPHIKAVGSWLRGLFAWSNSWQAWQERIGSLFLLASAFALWGFADRLPFSVQGVLWVLLIGAFVVLLHRGWVKLFGPVFFYDLVRTGRKTRMVAVRCLFAGLVFFALAWSFWWFMGKPRPGEPRTGLGGTFSVTVQSPRELAELGESFFNSYMIVQFAAIILLTPAYVGGAVAEEKERHTLEYMLATDLRNREIVLGKLASRVANLTLIVLAGLPVLSVAQVLGGISAELLVAGFAALGLMLLSLASVSMFWSVHARRARDAIVLSYATLFAYIILSFVSYNVAVLSKPTPAKSTLIAIEDDEAPPKPDPLPVKIDRFISAGNFLVAHWKEKAALQYAEENSVRPPVTLADLLRDYAIFHGSIILLCCGLAVARLRAVVRNERISRREALPWAARLFGRPRVRNHAMLWKEVYLESRLKLGWLGRLVLAILVLVSFAALVPFWIKAVEGDAKNPVSGLTLANWVMEPFENAEIWKRLGQEANTWVAITGAVISFLTFLGVAIRASAGVSGERGRDTLDGLLTTPLSAPGILLSKWAGSILSARWGLVWLVVIWVIAIALNALPLTTALILPLFWFVYASFYAWLGLWFSVVCRTGLRATLWTLAATLFLGGGHWIPAVLCCFVPLSVGPGSGTTKEVSSIVYFELGQTPAFVMGWFANQPVKATTDQATSIFGEIGFHCLFGLGVWFAGAIMIATMTMNRFREMTGREAVRKPEKKPPESESDKAAATPTQAEESA